MTLRLSRRDALELGVAAVCVVLAVVVVLAMLAVRGWERALSRGDARFATAPLPRASELGVPPPLPALLHWDLPHGIGATIDERLLGLRDDVEFRRALAVYRAALPNAREQQQFDYDRQLLAKRVRAQRALTAVAHDDPDPRIRSRAANMLGILLKGAPTPIDPQEQRTQLLAAIGMFRSAIKLDPGDDDAKLNLELILRDPQTEEFVGSNPAGSPDTGRQGGEGRAGRGY